MVSFDLDELEELRVAAAHDLKTPLTVIVGYAELLRARPDDPETLAEAPVMILEAAARLTADLDALAARFAGAAAQAQETSPPPPSPSPQSVCTPGAAPRGTGRPRILVVDDDDDLRRLLRATFVEDDFDVVEAGDGSDALRAVEELRPDVVVLDWQLPLVSGADVLAELARRPHRPHVIVLTAFGEADPVGADAFLLKPFSPIELLEAIGALLADAGSHGPNQQQR